MIQAMADHPPQKSTAPRHEKVQHPLIKAIADRPWIWIIVAYVVMIVLMAAFVVISVKYGDKDIPTPPHKIDY